MLESETRKMEEKLQLVKKMMVLEREKRSLVQNSNQGTIWRGATTKKDIKGYSNAVINHHKKTQPNLPNTDKVTEIESKAAVAKPAIKGQRQTLASKNFLGEIRSDKLVAQ